MNNTTLNNVSLIAGIVAAVGTVIGTGLTIAVTAIQFKDYRNARKLALENAAMKTEKK